MTAVGWIGWAFALLWAVMSGLQSRATRSALDGWKDSGDGWKKSIELNRTYGRLLRASHSLSARAIAEVGDVNTRNELMAQRSPTATITEGTTMQATDTTPHNRQSCAQNPSEWHGHPPARAAQSNALTDRLRTEWLSHQLREMDRDLARERAADREGQRRMANRAAYHRRMDARTDTGRRAGR